MFQGLNLHSGGQEVTIDALYAMSTPAPRTSIHTPIPHCTLLEQVKDSLFRTGFEIADETHAVHKDRYFGLMNLRSTYDDRNTTLGLRNSHDMTFPAGIALGSHVFVCSNLSFSGDISFKRKHTTNILRDLPQIVDAAVGKINGFTLTQDARFEAYKTTELSTKEADHAFMSALRAQVVSASTLPKILKEYMNPRHDEFNKDGFTVWRLYNSFTEHMKNSLWMLPRRSMALHGILDSFVNIPLEGELA